MPYTQTNWVDNTTPLSAAHLNNLETQYSEAMADIKTVSNTFTAAQTFNAGISVTTVNGSDPVILAMLYG